MTAVHTTRAGSSSAAPQQSSAAAGRGKKQELVIREARKAVLHTVEPDADDDWIPPL